MIKTASRCRSMGLSVPALIQIYNKSRHSSAGLHIVVMLYMIHLFIYWFSYIRKYNNLRQKHVCC